MKKAKILIAIALVFASVLTLASCALPFGGSLKFTDVYKPMELEDEALAVKTKWYMPNGRQYWTQTEGYYVLVDEDISYPYDTGYAYYYAKSSNEMFLRVSASRLYDGNASVSYNNSYGVTTYTYSTDDYSGKYRTEIYDYQGNKIATADSRISCSFYGDIMVFDDKVYTFDDETKAASLICDKPITTNVSFSTNTVLTEDFIITEKYDKYIYYNVEDLSKAGVVKIPSYALDTNSYILSSGALLIQYYVKVPESDNEYDLFVEGEKLNLKTMIYDPYKNSVKEIKVGPISGVSSRYKDSLYLAADYEEAFNIEEVPNIIVYYNVVDRRIDINAGEAKVLNNDGSIGADLPKIDGKFGMAQSIGPDYYIGYNIDGSQFLLDSNGEILFETDYYNVCDYGIRIDGKIYSKDLEEIFDYSDYSYVGGDYYRAVFADEDRDIYYLYDKEGCQSINLPYNNGVMSAEVTSYGTIDFVILDSNSTARLVKFNMEGEMLLNVGYSGTNAIITLEDGVIYAYENESTGEIAYCKIAREKLPESNE